MKAALLLLPALLTATAAAAQAVPDSTPPLAYTGDSSVRDEARPYLGSERSRPHVTPTMERQRLARALALRAKAEELQRQDGGKLTPEHAAFVRREATKLVRSWY